MSMLADRRLGRHGVRIFEAIAPGGDVRKARNQAAGSDAPQNLHWKIREGKRGSKTAPRIGIERIFLNALTKDNAIYALISHLPDKGLVSDLHPRNMIYRPEKEKLIGMDYRGLEPDIMIACYRREDQNLTGANIEVTSSIPSVLLHIEHWTEPYKYALLRVNAYQSCYRWRCIDVLGYARVPQLISIVVGTGPQGWTITPVKEFVGTDESIPDEYQFDVPHYSFHIRDVPDEAWLAVIDFTAIPYMWKGLGLKNCEKELGNRIGYVLSNYEGDPKRMWNAWYFLGYLLRKQSGFKTDIMYAALRRWGDRVMTNAEKLVRESLRDAARAMEREEGRKEGRMEIHSEILQSCLLDMLHVRFKMVSQAICEQIKQIRDLDILNRLYNAAKSATSKKAFEQEAFAALAGR
ncbi:MAG: hypothetical protein LBR22_00740 [Desulfovibrio sp.]|jgi:hypothetical protein|nr:hypothetical protein [Desulfovibrio sp.]